VDGVAESLLLLVGSFFRKPARLIVELPNRWLPPGDVTPS
jgi:hypothetical protein